MKFGVKVVFPILPTYWVIPSISTPQNNDDLICNIHFNNQEIDLAKLLNFLGVLLDVNLSWFQLGQIKKLSTRLNTACYQIRVLQDIVDFNTMKTVYFFYCPAGIEFGKSPLMQLQYYFLTYQNLIFQKRFLRKNVKQLLKNK